MKKFARITEKPYLCNTNQYLVEMLSKIMRTTLLDIDINKCPFAFIMINTIQFEYDEIYDLGTEISKGVYAVSGSFDKNLDVEIHQRLRDLDKPETLKDIVCLLRTMYEQKGYIINDIQGKSDSNYKYVDNDFVGTSTFIVEYE